MNIVSKLVSTLAVAAVILGVTSTTAEAGHSRGVSISIESGCGASYYHVPTYEHYSSHHGHYRPYTHYQKHRRHVRRHHRSHYRSHHTYNAPAHYYYGGNFHYIH